VDIRVEKILSECSNGIGSNIRKYFMNGSDTCFVDICVV